MPTANHLLSLFVAIFTTPSYVGSGHTRDKLQGCTRIVGLPKGIQDDRRKLQANNLCLCGEVCTKDIWDLLDKHVVE